MNMITNLIHRITSELGFCHFGIIKPSESEHFDVFQSWIAKNLHADMAYLSREDALNKRRDILKVFPNCQSIISLGFPYSKPIKLPVNQSGLHGQISAYAYNADYHDLIQDRLSRLARALQKEFKNDFGWKAYVDTGPLLEREIAGKAGLGWIGRNSSLIHPKFGSFFFLSELLIDIVLETDFHLIPDRCGNCQRCIEACPTQAILPNRSIDSNRCLSYLTIENKGPIPKEFRPLMGNHIFGCDVCQSICPWNSNSKVGIEPNLLPDQFYSAFPDLLCEIQLTPQEFNQKFKNSPIKRTKRRGYLRNVAVALGNTKSTMAIPALKQVLLGKDESLVRQHVAWALGEIPDEMAKFALLSALSREDDLIVRSEIISALENHA
jgi:epoxyqueuosine reductase